MDADTNIALLLSDQFRSALAILLTAFDYAADSGADRWQFAVELPDLLARGAALPDLRWLLLRGFAEHAKETTTAGDPARSFRPLAPTSFPPDTCLTLTPTGAATLRPAVHPSPMTCTEHVEGAPGELGRTGEGRSDGIDSPTPLSETGRDGDAHSPVRQFPYMPVWDGTRRELRFGAQVIKRFRQPAKNQETILASFQEEGWPAHIDDPLFGGDERDAQERLHNAIKRLNCQEIHLVNFLSDGMGQGVFWEPRRQPNQLRPMSDPLQQDDIVRNMRQ
jgi:hypothetical protein